MLITDTLVDERFILAAINGSRLSYGSNSKSDSYITEHVFVMGEEDEKFCQSRIAAGVSGEDKFLRTILVSCMIKAPLKWWVELDTYKIGTVRQSSSLMHRTKARGFFTRYDFDVSDEDFASEPFQVMFTNLNKQLEPWLETGRRSDKWDVWTQWQDLVPRSYIYVSHWVTNYAVLRLIYRVRKNHRMSSQWKPFCAWVESLPQSWLITYSAEKE